MRHTLYFTRANADQVLDVLTEAQSLFFNCAWHMSMPFEESQTHNVYCELRKDDLAAAQAALKQITAGFTPPIGCELRPDKI